jgi:hypothetical protein
MAPRCLRDAGTHRRQVRLSCRSLPGLRCLPTTHGIRACRTPSRFAPCPEAREPTPRAPMARSPAGAIVGAKTRLMDLPASDSALEKREPGRTALALAPLVVCRATTWFDPRRDPRPSLLVRTRCVPAVSPGSVHCYGSTPSDSPDSGCNEVRLRRERVHGEMLAAHLRDRPAGDARRGAILVTLGVLATRLVTRASRPGQSARERCSRHGSPYVW